MINFILSWAWLAYAVVMGAILDSDAALIIGLVNASIFICAHTIEKKIDKIREVQK